MTLQGYNPMNTNYRGDSWYFIEKFKKNLFNEQALYRKVQCFFYAFLREGGTN